MGLDEKPLMTCGEKMAICVFFSVGLMLMMFARIVYLSEQLAVAHGPSCKELCCVAKTNSVSTGGSKTNKPSPFVQGLKTGFEKGLEAVKEKEKGKE